MTTSVDRTASAKSSASAASVMGPGADPATLLEEKGNVVCCINMKLGVMHIVCVRKTLMFKLNIQTCFVVIMCYLTCYDHGYFDVQFQSKFAFLSSHGV